MTGDRVQLGIATDVIAELRAALPSAAARTVAALIAEVAEYRAAGGEGTAATIKSSVELALDTFLTIATAEGQRAAEQTPTPVLEAAYDLGRGEARAGRTMEALLAAYRVGARVAWEDLSSVLVERGIAGGEVARFAQLVFAYIDELSSASAAGHRDELAVSGRAREQLVEQLGVALLSGAPPADIAVRAERVDWPMPETITAVVLRTAQVSHTVQLLDARTLRLTSDLAPGLDDEMTVLLVPDAHQSRPALMATLRGRDAIVGPPRPWTDARLSYERVLRVLRLGLRPSAEPTDTEAHLTALVVSANPTALDDLRRRSLTPLESVRAASAERLVETLRAWLLLQGRRDLVAAYLNVHPQTIRYRMTQLRTLFGDRLDDPDGVFDLILATAGAPIAD